jgi:hypothetical protein
MIKNTLLRSILRPLLELMWTEAICVEVLTHTLSRYNECVAEAIANPRDPGKAIIIHSIAEQI